MSTCRHGYPLSVEHGWTDGTGQHWVCCDGVITEVTRAFTWKPRPWWRQLIGWFRR